MSKMSAPTEVKGSTNAKKKVGRVSVLQERRTSLYQSTFALDAGTEWTSAVAPNHHLDDITTSHLR